MNKKALFINYPKCSTCVKARKWLVENSIDYDDRNIVENNPTEFELKEWIEKSGLPVKRFFNTSGRLYKEMNLKDKVKVGEDDELIKLLATNGMLVKRPILVMEDKVFVGFKDWTID